MSHSDAPVFYRPAQLAEMLGVQPQTLSAWRRRGDGPPFTRFSATRVAYPADALQEWLAERTAASTAEEAARAAMNSPGSETGSGAGR